MKILVFHLENGVGVLAMGGYSRLYVDLCTVNAFTFFGGVWLCVVEFCSSQRAREGEIDV